MPSQVVASQAVATPQATVNAQWAPTAVAQPYVAQPAATLAAPQRGWTRQQIINFAESQHIGMGFYKFLVYFALIASAVICFIYATVSAVGTANLFSTISRYSSYYSSTQSALLTWSGIVIVTLIILCVVTGIILLAVWSQLANFKPGGISLLNGWIIALAVICTAMLLILLCAYVAMGYSATYAFTQGASYMWALIYTIVCLLINNAYFKNRRHLFVN